MKNQYVADIGDYGKYALLRAFANAGVKVGINWYLTEDDGSTDGKFIDYLEKGNMRYYDPGLFDVLKAIAYEGERSVKRIEDIGLIPDAIFYSELLNPMGGPDEREQERNSWFEESTYELANAELIYCDPDTGLLEDNDPGKLGAEKYVLPDEIEEYYRSGKNVIYYCHKGRRKLMEWFDYKSFMCDRLLDVKPIVLTYHKGTQRSYVFLIHKEDYQKYNKIIKKFLSDWRKIFSEEYTNAGDISREPVSEKFSVENPKDGSVLTLYKRADGWIQIEKSDVKGTSHAIRPETLVEWLWH